MVPKVLSFGSRYYIQSTIDDLDPSKESLYIAFVVDMECKILRVCGGKQMSFRTPCIALIYRSSSLPPSFLIHCMPPLFGTCCATSSRHVTALTCPSGLCTTLATLCLSSSIGTWIDQSPSRLRVLLLTISINRAAVILACIGWLVLTRDTSFQVQSKFQWSSVTAASMKPWLFSFVVGLGIFEKLSAVSNMISMERDWVPTLTMSHNASLSLTHLNAIMRRIDLSCKLVAPLIISLIITTTSIGVGILFVASMSTLCWGIEVCCARRVWASSPRLRELKVDGRSAVTESTTPQKRVAFRFGSKQWTQLQNYFSTDVWAPSLALALLHLSVLSYSATFITFLLNRGFSLIIITLARAAGSVVEVSSTFVAPLGIKYLALWKRPLELAVDEEELLNYPEAIREKDHTVGLARSGLWGITLQLTNLVCPSDTRYFRRLTPIGACRSRDLVLEVFPID